MPKTYSPSGEFPASAIFGVFFSYAAISSILAVPYALAIIYVPLVFLNVISIVAWCLAASAVAGYSIKIAKGRNPAAAGFLAVLGSLVGYYVHWAFWLSVHSQEGYTMFGALLGRPMEVFSRALEINSAGTWGIRGGHVSGAMLWIVWAAELMIYLCVAFFWAKETAEEPFDETGQVWYKKADTKNNLFAAPSDKDELGAVTRKIQNNDYSYFADAPLAQSKEEKHFELTLWTAPSVVDAYGTVVLQTPVQKGKKVELEPEHVIKYGALPYSLANTLVAKMAQGPPHP